MSLRRLSPLPRLSRSLARVTTTQPPRAFARLYSSAQAVASTPNDTPEFTALGHNNAQGLLVNSNWTTLEDRPLTHNSVYSLLQNSIPSIRHRSLLSKEECSKLVGIIQDHGISTYNQKVVFPPLGSVGLSQFDHDKETYLSGVERASSLQKRFREEANVDVVGRVAAALQKATGLETRVALEDGRPYFAGMLRVVSNYIQIHSDYGPFDGPDWEIGGVVGQLSWNVLLRQVHGGDTIIYDRQWNGAADNAEFRKKFPSYAFQPLTVQGRIPKALAAIEGDLTFFNSRNFHEVKPCDMRHDTPEDTIRYTMSSFVGLLPASNGKPPCLVLWS
ncbi:uncharacterized protein F4822DRAFT_430102 [Hypoxylon trugodes]|uniref:uncharacterized protein n=1 Tax=Hypoxylon trugodes TaxID=326681 RepID=UPI002197824D|nr:uncharacterized protein F4822DRAFT_430102 [Hypoxylon trugodes]KAI1387348.1 hypothetical protein F4822DRAFT_430102 [Hypoxylon trugodes]